MISIVIPVYNEHENITPLYESIEHALHGLEYEIIFVDDGSTDESYHTIRELHERDGHVKCVRLARNFGKTAALTAGFEMAQGDIIVTMDGDLQNDPGDIPGMIAMLEEYDAVSGWRHDRKDPLLSKKVPSRISNRLSRWLTGLPIHDFNCGLKAYKKETLEGLELYGEMHRYIPAILAWKGYTVGEMKVRHHERKHGESKYGFSRLLRGLLDLINFKFWAGYSTRPLHFFGAVGLVLFVAGFFADLYLVMLKLLYGENLSERPLLLLGMLLMIIGFQIFMIGFLAEIMVRNYYSSSGKKIYTVREKLE